jgi:hypothetical protein
LIASIIGCRAFRRCALRARKNANRQQNEVDQKGCGDNRPAPTSRDVFFDLAHRPPPGVFFRAGDAIQLLSARESGEQKNWTNDQHLLAAAPHVA